MPLITSTHFTKSAKVTAELTACCIQVCMEGMLARSQFDSFLFVFLSHWRSKLKTGGVLYRPAAGNVPKSLFGVIASRWHCSLLSFLSYWKFYAHLFVLPYLLENSLTFYEQSQHAYSPPCIWKINHCYLRKETSKGCCTGNVGAPKCDLLWNFEHANIMLSALVQVPFF